MKYSSIVVSKYSSSKSKDIGNLVVSVREKYDDSCDVVIGYPGLPNVIQRMNIGDTILFETPSDGVMEVRLFKIRTDVEFLITQISPRLGIIGGFIDDDPNNTPFTSSEFVQVADSINRIQHDINLIQNITPGQLNLIERKLKDIKDACQRLGRKDWINYVAGALTSMCVSASFAPDTTKALFKIVSSAFKWLFDNTLILLS